MRRYALGLLVVLSLVLEAAAQPPTTTTKSVLRLNFSFQQANVTLVSHDRYLKVPPKSLPLSDSLVAVGFWYELRDSTGTPLFRRTARNPLRDRVEVLTDSGRVWLPLPNPSGFFSLVVPDLPEAMTAHVFARTHTHPVVPTAVATVLLDSLVAPPPPPPPPLPLPGPPGPPQVRQRVGVVDVVTVVDHGDWASRFDLVVLSEGYKLQEMDDFHNDVDTFIATLAVTPPFDALWDAINIIRIDVVSKASGISDTGLCGYPSQNKQTFFSASFCAIPPADHLMSINQGLVISTVGAYVPNYDQILVIANDAAKLGGRGFDKLAVTSKYDTWPHRAIHEIGHGAFALDDEYGGDAISSYNPDSDPDGLGPNLVQMASDAYTKWGQFILPETDVPNWECQSALVAFEEDDPVGAYAGGKGWDCGLYHPQSFCKMNFDTSDFCAVCAYVIGTILLPFLTG